LSTIRRYAIAILLTLLALSIGLLGESTWGAAATYSFFLGAVMLSSWISGVGPGLLSTVLGLLAADYYLLPPIHHLTFDLSRAIQLSAFAAIAVLISSLNDSRRRAMSALAAARAQLEDRVVERTAALALSNEHLRDEIERRSRSERSFRGLIDAAPDAILVMDGEGHIVKVNQEAERMFGYSRDALLGRDVDVIIPDRFKAAHHAQRVRFALAPGARTVAGDLSALRADGTEVPVEIRIGPLDSGGDTVVGIVRDVTERQRSQAMQTRLLHDLGERVKELTALHAVGRLLNEPGGPADLLPRIVELLPGAWQYADIARARIVAGSIDARSPGFAETPWRLRAVFEMPGAEAGAIEIVYAEPRPDAAEGPFLLEERTLIDSLAGMLQSYFVRRQVEEQRVELARSEVARQQAQEANAAKDQFLATLSHELRSPLNVMLGWIDMLRSGAMSAESMARGFDVLDRSVRLQSKLIDDLLDVSRIVAGKLRVDKRPVDLAAVAANAVDAARPAARDRQVALTATIDPALWMQADPQRLHQVVSNLLTNALKFTPANGSIDVRVERVGGRARIVVRDTGIGIPSGLLPRIFDRFQQGDSATTRTHSGLGLGLAIAKHIVEQHGGEIAAASEGLGHGASFTLTFPLWSHEAALSEPAEPDPIDRSLLSGVRVLVVDDEPDTRSTLRVMLERFGATATAVATASEAFDAVHENPPDVLLSDIAMPDEDGCALMRRIRADIDAAHLPAAALTAHVEAGTRSHAADAGFQEYLTKPIDPAVLARTLARLIHRGNDVPPAP
jgi:PAS domain S-box-containing protein